MRRAFVALAFLLLPAAAFAQERPRFASFFLENDFFAGTDRHYTNGLQVAFVTPLAALPQVVRDFPPFDRSTERDVVLAAACQ